MVCAKSQVGRASKPARVTAMLAMLFATLVAGLSVAQPADAAAPCASTSCAYNYHNSAVLFACWDGGCTPGAYRWESNGRGFLMGCWFDDRWFNGNYNSNRWFVGTLVPLTGRWLVHSSYVYNQVSVNRC